ASGHRGSRAGGDSFDDVAAAPDAAVAEDFGATTDRVRDGRDQRGGRGRAVELPAAVVRKCDRVDTGVGGDDGVFDRLNSLHDDGALPDRAEPLDIGPSE